MAKIELLNTAEREGETISSSYQLAADAKGSCIFWPVFDLINLQDMKFLFSLGIDISGDGQKWQSRAGMNCVGTSRLWNKQPSLGIPMINIKEKYIRAHITVNKKVEYKLEMENGI